MSVIEMKNLSFAYEDGALALDNVNISIKKGCVTALLGGNGAGKSTLFLNMNGVLIPKSGECIFEGMKVTYNKLGIKALREGVGIVFQDPNDQLFSASVRNDIAFGVLNMGVSNSEAVVMVEEVAKSLNITHLLDKPTHALSFGQKKRVATAGVLIMNPKVIVLDEPTAGLDPAGVTELLKLLSDLGKSENRAIVISTHDVDMVPLYCDYVYVMKEGRVTFGGEPKELFANANIVRENRLRLPRIAHLMEILANEDKLPINKTAVTISQARRVILDLLKKY